MKLLVHFSRRILFVIIVYVILTPVVTHAVTFDDLMNRIKSLEVEITNLRTDLGALVLNGGLSKTSSTPKPPSPNLKDLTPRIAYWSGKVNQHIDTNGNWLTDPDGTSGATLDKFTYCKKWYPNTIYARDYKTETITTWRNADNTGGPFTLAVMTTECVKGVVVAPPSMGEEFIGPFPSWVNVKTKYGAVGNGIADDTIALQAAFDSIPNSTASVVYLPAGTYRITTTLKMNFKINIAIIGEDPATTKIKWAGPVGGTMTEINGTAYSRFNRITWDGSSSANIAVDQSWDASKPHFDTDNEYADDVFVDVGFGIHGGHRGYGFAETKIMRSKFIRNTIAGVSLGNFNALDTWIWNSVFEDCAIGVTNVYGAGAFFVYKSIFRNSKIADMKVANTSQLSIRDNTSINSTKFFLGGWTRNPAATIFQGNTIIDPIDPTAIRIENHGPVTLMDNIFRSRAGATGPVVYHNAVMTNDITAIDNIFTLPNPIQVGGGSRLLEYGTTVSSLASLANLSVPVIPGPQPNLNRKIFEVPLNATAATVQGIINQALLYTGNRPVIHFPYGTYNIATTLEIPKGSDIQLVGDELGTILKWTGTTSGPVIKILGPTKTIIRTIGFDGSNAADGIVVTNADQIGSRVFVDDLEARVTIRSNFFADSLDNTQVYLTNGGYFYNKQGVGIKVKGGAQDNDGSPQTGKTIVFAGTGSSNVPQMQLTNGGSLHVRDYWYENSFMAPFINLSGSALFTMEGSRVASPQNTATPIVSIKDFFGKATFINSYIDDRLSVSGYGTGTKMLALGMAMGDGTVYVQNTASPAADARLLLSRDATQKDPNEGGSISIPNIGIPQENFIREMLAPIRTIHTPVLQPLAPDVTDFRVYRIWVVNALDGIRVQSAN